MFEWSPFFETGLADVDAQHQRLVGLLNGLTRDVDSASPAHLGAALVELAEYTQYHFRCEEDNMRLAGVFDTFYQGHCATHQRFVQQVSGWIEAHQRGEAIDIRKILSFLADWLIFHILGDDLSMGRQIRAIAGGATPEEALFNDRSSDDPRTDVLLGALRRLYASVAERNEELSVAQQSLAALNATLERKVQERTADLQAAHEQLVREQENAIESEKMASLGRMVAGFAHEINTPIGIGVSVLTQAQQATKDLRKLFQSDEVEEADLTRCVDVLDEALELGTNNINRAAELVGSFKRTAVDQSSEQEREFDLAELLADVVRSHHSVFRKTAIQIDVDCPAGLKLFGLPGALVQVIGNLLNNARIHAFDNGKSPGHIRIGVVRAAETVTLTFADDGAGMSKTTLASAFEPFYTTARGQGGSGLGLYIVYNLVTRNLHGAVHCESDEGQGSRFVIQLPLSSRAGTHQQET